MIIFDMSNLFFINLYESIKGEKKNTTVPFDPNVCRYMIFNTIRAVTSRYKGKYGEVVFACDSRRFWRKDIFPYYKANRKKDREAQTHIDWPVAFAFFDEIKKEIKQYTKYKIIEVDLAEADDIIAVLAIKYDDTPNLIVSTDKDFRQLQVYTSCSIYNTVTNKMVKEPDPFAYLLHHIIKGDRGDGIPSIIADDDTFVEESKTSPKMTANKLHYFLTETVSDWDSPEALARFYAANKTPLNKQQAIKDQMVFAKNTFIKRNKPLIDLREVPDDIRESIIAAYQEEKSPNMRSLFDYFYKFNLTRLMDKLGDF